MKKGTRLLLIMMAVALCFGHFSPARAEVMTLGIYFRGLVPQEDGTEVQIPLTGSFRVMQGGMEKGTVRAGETTLTVAGSDPVTLVPMAETIPAGWDLTEARVTVAMADGSNVTVPILVHALEMPEETGTPTPAPTPAPTETPREEAETELLPLTEEDVEVSIEEVAETWAATPTPGWNPTPVPVQAATAVPDVSLLKASETTGTFHVRVWYDRNTNADFNGNEKGVEGIPVYIVDENGEAVTGGETGEDGEIVLPGLEPGTYRIRVALPEEYGFSRKTTEIGLNKSCMDFSDQAVQDSDPLRISAGETVERGVGLLKGVVTDGVCWLDENGDGIMGAEEPRVTGVHITMDGQKNGLHFEAWSDENGYWRINRLRAGFYDFTAYTPDGMMFTKYSRTGGVNRSVFTAEGKTKQTKTLDLNDGEDQLNQHVGFAWSAIVRGQAFLDANYNGLYDEGEKPLAGVKVTAIKQAKDEEIAVTYTDEDGAYTLSGLRGNTYTIRAVLPDDGSNFTVTVDDPEGNHFKARDNRRENFWKDFVLQNGEERTVNVGAIYYGSVSGTVYMDDDFSGDRNGKEKVAQGISVRLLDAQGTLVESKQTTAKGAFSFTGLTPGRYSLRMTARSGYAFTKLGEGNVMLNLNGGEGYSETFEVPLGESVTDKDAGMIMPGTVKGQVFADENDNGRRDSGEKGLTGTAVRLMSEEGEAFSAVVSESGEFLFDAVMPGRYRLEYQLPQDGIFARAGGDNTIAEAEGEAGIGRGDWFELTMAGQKEAPLCGGLILGKISGTFFHDTDGDGSQGPGEESLAGLTLTLTPTREDLAAAETVADSDGSFALTGLHPDTYSMRLTLPDGMTVSRIPGVTLPVTSGAGDQETSLTVSMGQTWTEQRIGGVVPGALRGIAWLDENNDGTRNEGEAALAGAAVTVTDEMTGGVFATLTADDEGRFAHEGMMPGSYTVSYGLGSSEDVPKTGDSTFRKEGNALEMTGISLAEGGTADGIVLGIVKYTALGGQVWIDRGNGTQPLAGAVIQLLDGDGNTLETRTTGDGGDYRFEGLMPGDYRIAAELPEGNVAVEPADERLAGGLISVLAETEGRLGRTETIALKMGQDQLEMNIGSVLPGTIGDLCWLDENGNGWQDGGEYGIPHVKVELVRNGVTVAETETDQYGLWFFREVYPAVYTLKATAPAEVKPTRKGGDIYLIDSSLNQTEDTTAYTDEFSVGSDSTDFNYDLGYVLRSGGVYPAGYGQQETMDWSRAYIEE